MRIRSDIDRIRIQPLRTNRIRIHEFFNPKRDPDPEKFENRIRHPDPVPDPKHAKTPDPTGFGSATL